MTIRKAASAARDGRVVHRPLVAGLLVLVAAVGSACAPAEPDMEEMLVGTWEWTGTTGGVADDVIEPSPGDPVATLEFTNSGTVIRRREGMEPRTETWRLASDTSVYDGEEHPALFFSDDPVGRILEIGDEGRTLALSDNAEDGYSSTFRRSEPIDR